VLDGDFCNPFKYKQKPINFKVNIMRYRLNYRHKLSHVTILESFPTPQFS
jgi:hypothetical protein